MIALDAMGGDYAPEVTVQGAVLAARKGLAVTLYGNAPLIHIHLQKFDPSWARLPLMIVDSQEVINMAEEPARAVMRKRDASMVKAAEAVVQGTAQAMVTAGNSGAALVLGTLKIGRVPGVLRPALASFLPAKQGYFFCLDLGANVDCKSEYLFQFAQMGSAYVTSINGIAKPRVGLLSNGHEPYKGSSLVKESFKKISASRDINFMGNIEPRDIFDNTIDVLVCDGFAGNIMLKTMQGTLKAFSALLKKEQELSWQTTVGFSLAQKAFENVKKHTDYARMGGAILLGIQQPLIVAHGCSTASAIESALMLAQRVIEAKTYEHVNTMITHTMVRQPLFPNNMVYFQESLGAQETFREPHEHL